MPDNYWRPQAGYRPQYDSITVATAPTAGDIGTIEIGNSTLTVTAQSGTTTEALFAAAIKNAINAAGPTDNLVANESRNAGGQQLPEFRDVYAEISPTNAAVVLVKSVVPGVPFFDVGGTTLSATESGATLNLTAASVQTATGQWHWNNAANWSGGSVPANDDVVIFDHGSVGPKYGLPNGSLEVTILQYQSFTGDIGLPPVNTSNGMAYYEYRQRYVRLDDAGGGSNIAHRFGLGEVGAGSPLINVKHSTVKASPIVFNTGKPRTPGTHALNICCTTNTSTINILDGSVDYSSQDGSTSAFVTVDQSGGESRGITAIHTTGGIATIAGGKAVIGGAGAINTVTARGTALVRMERQTGTITNMAAYNRTATIEYPSTGTITSLIVDAATFDARENSGKFTVTGGTIHNDASFLDPYRRMIIGSAFTATFDFSDRVQFGGSSANSIQIVNGVS